MQPGPNNAIEVVNERSRLVQLDRAGLAPAAVPGTTFRPDATGTLSGPLVTPTTIPADGVPTQFNVTVDPGGGGASFTRLVTLNYGGVTVSDYATLRGFLEAAIRAADVNKSEERRVG